MLETKLIYNLENSLILETIRLFSFVAKADDVVSEEEAAYVRNYFTDQLSPELSQQLFTYFESYLEEPERNFQPVLKNIARKHGYSERVFILFKLLELSLCDGLSPQEEKVMDAICSAFELPPDLIARFLEMISGSQKDSDLLYRGGKACVISHHPSGDALFGSVDFSLLLVSRSLFIYSRSQGLANSAGEVKPHSLQKLYYNDHLATEVFQAEVADLLPIAKVQGRELKIRLFQQGYTVCWQGLSYQIEPHETTSASVPLMELSQQDRLHMIRETAKQVLQSTAITAGNNPCCQLYVHDELDRSWHIDLSVANDELQVVDRDCPYTLRVNRKKVQASERLGMDSRLYLSNYEVWYQSEEGFHYRTTLPENIRVSELEFRFKDGSSGFEQVSFDVEQGEMVAIMGPSGSGKTTLLNALAANFKPAGGQVWIDDFSFLDDFKKARSYISYSPQQNVLCDNLTVYENLLYSSRLRNPRKGYNHRRKVLNVLRQIDLLHKKDVRVGSIEKKVLSGGERKRLNIGLELLQSKGFYIFDEPTSGLSSADSLKILQLISGMAGEGKMVFLSIHQPSQQLFEFFNKLILLDKGGKLIYAGHREKAISFFHEYIPPGLNHKYYNEAELIFETIQQPVRDLDGNSLGIRKYTPTFWQEKFSKRLKAPEEKKLTENPSSGTLYGTNQLSWKERVRVWFTLLQRNFKNKLIDRSNIAVSFIAPPFLALLIGLILRYHSPGEEYTLYDNNHLKTFIFLACLVPLFLGITSAIEEIIKDRAIINKEKRTNVTAGSLLFSKVVVALFFAIIQNTLFIVIAFGLLKIREMHLKYILFLTLISLVGIGAGLLVSSFKNISLKAAVNLVPLILIPQIIFGGALIKFEKMNRSLTLMKGNPIPEFCNIIPSRWAFEGLLLMHYNNNSFSTHYQNLHAELSKLNLVGYREELREEITRKTGYDQQAAKDSIERIQTALDQERMEFRASYGEKYGNQSMEEAVKGANDKNRNTAFHGLFALQKVLPFTGVMISTVMYDLAVLVVFALGFLCMVYVILRRYYFG